VGKALREQLWAENGESLINVLMSMTNGQIRDLDLLEFSNHNQPIQKREKPPK
jgi:hypothetical protein